MTATLVNSVQQKNKFYRIKKEYENNPLVKLDYNTYKTRLTSIIREAEIKYFSKWIKTNIPQKVYGNILTNVMKVSQLN